MNFFYHNDDPLLQGRLQNPLQYSGDNLSDTYAQLYKQQLMNEFQNQQIQTRKDWIAELDNTVANLDQSARNALANDQEYIRLSQDVQMAIQNEIVKLIKPSLNNDPKITDNISKQLDIISKISDKAKAEERQNMSDLNDYIKNYSHLTFDEYKKIKNNETRRDKTETTD